MRRPPYGFDINLANIKTVRRMAQIYVAFLKKLNFNNSNRKTVKKIATVKSESARAYNKPLNSVAFRRDFNVQSIQMNLL